ncbi:MAG: hypothetical protein DMF59_11570 [Acidobacteria bacterium]|nr:MAG: hypothetical protein DMF59_11570 [Acidobacteriota bacterium]
MAVAASQSMWWVRETPTASHEKAGGTVAFAAVVLFTCVLLLSPQAWFPALKPLRIAFLAGGLAAASLLWERWRERTPLGLTREIVICFLLLAWTFMTLPLSYWPGGSVATLTDIYIKAVIVFWLLANVITTERRLQLIRNFLILCSVPLAVTAVKNFVTGSFLGDAGVVARIAGYGQGLSANPNDLALMLNLMLPLSIASFLSAKSRSMSTLLLVVTGVNVIGVVVTFCRAGFLGLATIGTVYFLKMVRRRGADRAWAFALAIAALVALPMLPSNYFERVATIANIHADPTGSSQIRWRDTVAAMHFVFDHPIVGAGLGMDVLALNQVRGEKWYAVHNVYLQYAVDLGLPGALLFILLLLGTLKGARSSRKRLAQLPEKRELFLLAEALEISLIVFAISGFFYPVAYNFYFYYMGGLALAVRAVTQQALSTTSWRSNS